MSQKEISNFKSNRDTVMTLIPVVAVLGKLIRLFILPDKYFYDSFRMQSMLNGDGLMQSWGGYEAQVEIYRKINFFGFTSVRQWSIAFGILFTILLMILISKVKEMSFSEAVFTLMAVGLMNIYTFTIAKEPIQLFFFLCIALVIGLPIENTFVKIIGCCLVFYLESDTFRSYYIIMAAMAFLLYFIFLFLKKTKITKTKIIFAVVLCFGAMFLFVYFSQYIDYASYEKVLFVKEQNSNEGANSAILNVFEPDGSMQVFMINYIINSIRMMIPVELILKSPVYFPFFVYQLFILVYWIKTLMGLKRIDSKTFLALACFTAYLFGSFVFEPDFGSWVRHESASFPIFYWLAYEELRIKRNYR